MVRAKDARVFITGGSSGIGAALAREFAKHGAKVVIASRNHEGLARVREAIRATGGWAEAVFCDVTDDRSVVEAVGQALDRLGGLEVAVANAGFGVVGPVEELTVEDFHRQFETNVYGVIRTAKAVLPALKASRGVLAIMGSVSGYLATPGGAPYAMSKFAVRALAESLRGELSPYGVGVVLISPGFVESNIRRVDNRGVLHPDAPDPVPAWLVMPAEKAARIMVRAILKRKPEVIVTGHGKVAVFLARHCPRLVRALLTRARARSEPQR